MGGRDDDAVVRAAVVQRVQLGIFQGVVHLLQGRLIRDGGDHRWGVGSAAADHTAIGGEQGHLGGVGGLAYAVDTQADGAVGFARQLQGNNATVAQQLAQAAIQGAAPQLQCIIQRIFGAQVEPAVDATVQEFQRKRLKILVKN